MYYIYRYVCGQKNESYFSDQLTFSNIRGRISRRIYRPALPLHSPETLSSSNKSTVFLYNVHLALLVWMDDTITRTNSSVSVVIISKLELASEVRPLPSRHCLQTRQLAELLQTGKECEYDELHFRRGSPLACWVMGIACSSCQHYLLSYCIIPQTVSFWR